MPKPPSCRRALSRVGAAVVLAAVHILLPEVLAAQPATPSPGILSDRPGLGDGAHVLPPGVW